MTHGNSYRITGIASAEKKFFDEYYDLRSTRRRRELADYFNRYLSGIHRSLSASAVSLDQLTPRSRCALFNLEGLVHLALEKPHAYTNLYREIREEHFTDGPLRKKELILRFSASSRLHHRLIPGGRQLHLRLAFEGWELTPEYFRQISRILFARLAGQPPSSQWKETVFRMEREYLDSKKARGDAPTPAGETGMDPVLVNMFRRLNNRYFHGELPLPHLQWSRRSSIRRLGTYQAATNRLVLNRVLAQPDVPEFVREGILYHEMLHMKHPAIFRNGRYVIHGADFKRDEKKFQHAAELRHWLKTEYRKIINHRARSSR